MGELERLARERFVDPPLTEAELRLLRAASKGELAVCGPNADSNDPANDPSRAEEWSKDREIRADLIRWLCVNRQAKELIDPRGIRVFAAKVSENLDLSNVTIQFPFYFLKCRLVGDRWNLAASEIAALNLNGTRAEEIFVEGTIIKGNVFLRDGFQSRREVRLLAARIGGALDCSGATFRSSQQGGRALSADGIVVGGSMFLDNASVDGAVGLPGAQIGGDLSFCGSRLTNPTGSGIALYGDRALVAGSLFLNQQFHAQGEVRLLGTRVGQNLNCESAVLENPSNAGAVRGGKALTADGIQVGGSVFLRNRFRSEGEVRLVTAHIAGNLECDAGSFNSSRPEGGPTIAQALRADGIHVNGAVFLRNGFRADGDVLLSGAEIGGYLDCTGAKFLGTLVVEAASIKGALMCRDVADVEHLRLDLVNASAGALADDAQSWPVKGNLDLDGFVYKRIAQGPGDHRSRLKWLGRQEEFAPQPYRQLAKVLRDEGDDWGARRVLYEMDLRRRKKGDRNPFKRFWSAVLRRTIGYGYYPGNALAWLVLIVVLGWPLFRGAYFSWNMAPTDKDAYLCFHQKDHPLPANYEHFCASIYSLEKTFPLVKLGQVDRWQPDPSPLPSDGVTANPLRRLGRWLISPSFLAWFGRGQTVLGWILATLFAAGVTGVVRKD